MRDLPKGADLLLQARAMLLGELLDHLPKDKRYNALMIAHAMAIAARELEAAEAEGGRDDLGALNARLVEEIRGGRHDAAEPIHALLSHDARARLAVSNPKLLKT